MAPRLPFTRQNRRPRHRYASDQMAMPDVQVTIDEMHAKLSDWQKRVLKFADIVPEVQKGAKFVSNVMDLVTFEIEKYDRTTNTWAPADAVALRGVERKLNLAFKAGRAARLMHLVEECFILVDRTSDNEFKFETLSPTEIRKQGSRRIEKRVEKDGDKLAWKRIGEGTTIIRVWSPDDDDRHEATGPHKPLLNLLETMALELMSDQADAVSVLAGAGLLLIPTEVLPDEVDTLDASETPGSRRGFEQRLEDAMMLPITDRKRGEAVVPIALYGPADALKEVRHVTMDRRDTAAEKSQRMERYANRYAGDIDLPKEVILGIGDANHWSGWKVDENTWAYSLQPRGQQIADALYRGLVRFIVQNLGFDPSEHRLAPNASAAIAKTDRSGVARDAYGKGAITGEAYMEATGFAPDDLRPDADELLVASITGAGAAAAAVGEALRPALPDRAAAAKSPAAILRQGSKIANSHQAKLTKIYDRFFAQIAAAAARDGKRAKAAQAKAAAAAATDRTAADEIPFIDYEPGTYFNTYRGDLMTSTNDELFAMLRRVSTLTGTDYRTLRQIWALQFEQRSIEVARQAEQLAETVARASWKSGTPTRIPPSYSRTLSSAANGGSQATNGAAGNLSRPVHAAEDPALREPLRDTAGEFATKYRWVTGDPLQPFPDHADLDGTEWFSWQEFDKLDVSHKNEWLPGTVYFPGDHDGCQCSYEIDFVPIEEAT